jgi:hypothetical protein
LRYVSDESRRRCGRSGAKRARRGEAVGSGLGWGVKRALILLAFACARTPEGAVEQARAAIENRDEEKLRAVLDTEYADPLGDEEALLADVRDLWERHPKIVLRTSEVHELDGPSELQANLQATLDADFVGTPTWKVKGPLDIELARRSDGFRIRSNLLTTFRDVSKLMAARRAALEANDAEEVRKLLSPDYRDGDLDADGAIGRLAKDLAGTKVRLEASNYRLELRGAWAHVDEHFVLVVNDRPTRPLVARFSLKTNAGRWRISGGLYPASAEPR